MIIQGWNRKYAEIAKEFGYNIQLDYQSAIILDHIMRDTIPDKTIATTIKDKTVFVIGAGTSLETSISILKKFKKIVKIAADSAAKPLIENNIVPDILVTDLDGDKTALKRCSKKGAFIVVHAHGDNIPKLYLARSFNRYLGTTQAEPFGKIRNFGGFTDGDRAVFLASHFGARKIVLFGMDYNNKIGKFSNTSKDDVKIKLKKLAKSKKLLEWLAERTRSELFTTSTHIRGFKKILPRDLVLLE